MRKVAFLLSLFLIFTIPWEDIITIPGLGTGVRLFGIVLSSYWLITVLLRGKIREYTSFHFMLIAFVCWAALSCFWSSNPHDTLTRVITWFRLLIMVFIIWDLYTTKAAVLVGLQAYVMGAVVAASSAVSNYLLGHTDYNHEQRFTPTGTNPDDFGVTIALSLAIAFYLISSDICNRHNKASKLLKLFNFLAIPLVIFGIVLSGTRTALIIATPGMFFGIASLTRASLRFKVATSLFLISLLFVSLPYIQSMPSFQRLGTTASEITSGDLNERTRIWKEGLTSFAEHPLRGVGGNQFRSTNGLGKVAHNSFISVLVELGIIGMLLFSSILGISTIRALNHPKWDRVFWLVILISWTLGASALTWEYRKATWVFLSLLNSSAALNKYRSKSTSAIFLTKGGNTPEAIEGIQERRFFSDF